MYYACAFGRQRHQSAGNKGSYGLKLQTLMCCDVHSVCVLQWSEIENSREGSDQTLNGGVEILCGYK